MESRVTNTPRGSGQVSRKVGAAIRSVKGGGTLVFLAILFFGLFYQNLPAEPLNQVGSELASGASPTEYAGNTLFRIMRLCMIAVSVFVISTRWSLVRSLGRFINPGFAAFMILAPLSAVWSFDRAATLLRFTSFACVVLVCFAISLAGWNRQRLQQMAIPPTMCILIASLILGILYPDRITEIGDDISLKGAWHGITFTKNTFGALASLGVIMCAHRWLAGENSKSWPLAGAAVAATCLMLSRSSTSMLAAAAGVFFMVLVMRVPVIKRRFSTHVVIGLALTLILYQLVIQDVIPGKFLLKPVTSLTGKGETFSARTIIWDIIKEHIRQAPLLGTGYGAYWTGPVPTSPSYVFTYLMYFYPAESHNGYLELQNDLGYAGLSCVLLFLFWYIRQALQLMRLDRSQAILYLAVAYVEMIINMSESDWFSRSSNFTILILATFCLSRALLEHRLHAQSGVPSRVRKFGNSRGMRGAG